MDLEKIHQTFYEEVRELMHHAEAALLSLEQKSNPALLDDIFRSFHTVKGSASVFGFDPLAEFAHSVEDQLDVFRSSDRIPPKSIGILLEAVDHITKEVDCISKKLTRSEALIASAKRILSDLALSAVQISAMESDIDPPPHTVGDSREQGPPAQHGQEDKQVESDERSESAERSESDERVESAERSEATVPSTSIMSQNVVGEKQTVESVVLSESKELPETEKFRDVSLEQAKKNPARAEIRSLKVEAVRLDHLVNQVGELLVLSSHLSELASHSPDIELRDVAHSIFQSVDQLRARALSIRMVPVSEIFRRLQRIARDTAIEVNKEIQLTTRGDDTELDKSLMEGLVDPLMHLVRNAIDHGIESKDLRLNIGKPPIGNLNVSAFYHGGSVVIEMSDDGSGLDLNKIKEKAIQLGLINRDQPLTDQELYRFIFKPGFSTATEVSRVSGRGVGLDVVKRNIESIRGSIQIESEKSKGTRFTLRLPLTLAIIDGLWIEVGSTSFIIPMEMILECVDLGLAAKADYIDLRGEFVPILKLSNFFSIEGMQEDSSDVGDSYRWSVVIVQHGGQKAGILAQSLRGQRQSLVKPLGKLFQGARGLGGATVLGKEDMALILDIPALLEREIQLVNS